MFRPAVAMREWSEEVPFALMLGAYALHLAEWERDTTLEC